MNEHTKDFDISDQLTHKLRVPRLSLINMRSCLDDVLPSSVQEHRIPTKDKRIIINGNKELRGAAYRPGEMRVRKLDGAVSVVVKTERPFDGFDLYANNLRGGLTRIDTPDSVGFVALIGTDGRSFGVATMSEGNEAELCPIEDRKTAFAIVTQGLERAFRCAS